MIVTSRESIGTIGGGRLEYECTRIAARMLAANDVSKVQERRFVLGSGLGQCCGGVVDVEFEWVGAGLPDWLESCSSIVSSGSPTVLVSEKGSPAGRFVVCESQPGTGAAAGCCPVEIRKIAESMLVSGERIRTAGDYLLELFGQTDMHVALFGAGHVGTAVADALARIDCRVRWIDSRANMLPDWSPTNVSAVLTDDPLREVAAMPGRAYYLVMTHSHPRDLEICAAILRRGDFAYCGLIGSASKRRRFERMLRDTGLDGDLIKRLTCPIGISGITGKQPGEIATAVAAQLLQHRDASRAASANREMRVPA